MKNTNRVKEKIAAAFLELDLKPDVANEIAFHMTDWDHNMNELLKIYERVEQLSHEEIRQTVIKFLAHVPNHVAAAKKLAGLGPIEDVFGVNVFEEE